VAYWSIWDWSRSSERTRTSTALFQSTGFCEDSAIERSRVRSLPFDIHFVNLVNDPNLMCGTRDEKHTFRLEAPSITSLENLLRLAILVHQLAPKTVTCDAANVIAKLCNPPISRPNLFGEFPAVFPSHAPFGCFEDCGCEAAIVLKGFGTIVHRNIRQVQLVLVGCALIRVLEPPPAARVINKNCSKICISR
jgi:hypothetical protein